MTSHYDSWKMSSSLQSTGKFPCRLPTFQCGRGFPGGLVSGEHLLKSSLRAFPHVRLPVQQISSSHRVSLHWSGGAKYAKRRGTNLIHGIGKMGLSQVNAWEKYINKWLRLAFFGNKVGERRNKYYLQFSQFQVLGFELYDTLNKKNLAIFFIIC